ncbi:ATP-binding cassette domain-containing protein, partial [Bacillus velezensis]|nr:ATP-binding cassette domain-containing protein [Bacillus velezensis]
GEVVVVVGPSGSGKSTMLRCINALEKITGGELLVDGQSVRGNATTIRNIRLEAGMVFQQFNLFPQMTALENVMFGPIQVRGASRADARDQAMALLDKVGLESRANHYPSELSGGQQQRAAIARAMIKTPAVFLFDEPLSNLDATLRGQTRVEIARLHARFTQSSSVYVTHDQAEAKELGDRIDVMGAGRIEQIGTPREIYYRPANRPVAQFIGTLNRLAGQGRDGALETTGGAIVT